MAGTTRADAQDERTIVISREFDAPRELVFEAWTDPRHLAQWWGPRGYGNAGCEMDLRVGGTFRVLLRGPDGAIAPCKGVFREIVPPERIVYGGVADGGSDACGAGLPPNALVTVTFTERGGKTTVTIHTLLRSAADREAAVRMGFHAGWTQSLERLADFVADSGR
jgi:uncharacterized protein YndB with AHSA1/START domain